MAVFPLEREKVYASSGFARRGMLETRDPSLCEQYSGPWDVCISPTDNRFFHNSKDYLVMPGITLYRENYGSTAQVTGVLESGLVALFFPLQAGESRYFNSASRPGWIPCTDSTSVTGRFGSGEEHLILLAKVSLLQQLIAPDVFDYFLRCAQRHWLPMSPSGQQQLVNGFLSLMRRTADTPSILENSNAISLLEKDCIQQLVFAMDTEGCEHVPPRSATRQRGFKRVLDQLSSNLDRNFSIPELCQNAGVSQRSLEYAFRENVGLSAVSFAKTLRYHRLRRELLARSRNEVSIQELALNQGLYQLGRVAGEYRALFGEYPSDTFCHQSDAQLFGIAPTS